MHRELTAHLYAATHRGNRGDVGFYRRLCAGKGRVLELGAGSGRLLAALAHSKREVVGLELDRGLLALARQATQKLSTAPSSKVSLVSGDMRHFDLGQFERVLLPYNALFCLLTKRDALACFRSVRAALSPGGLFAFDVWNADPLLRSGLGRDNGDEEPLFSVKVAGRAFTVFERTQQARARQRLDVSYRYVPHDGGPSSLSLIRQRYRGSKEIKALLSEAGFVVQSLQGDFAGSRFGASAPHVIVCARAR